MAAVASFASPAAAADPVAWPASPGADPTLVGTAHSIRFAGPDRYQTNLATALGLRGTGHFPFDSPDRSLGGKTSLADAGGWWGARTCPRAILVVAGDTFADALAAASLSDATDRGSEPRLQRVAAADPLFDPVGGYDRVDTAAAPIIVTESARSGATALTAAARLSARDLAAGGCTSAREAVVVGGEGAVPPGVESELLGLGYGEVFRVAGADRYETAAQVALALGTGSGTSAAGCVDPDATDATVRQGFYGNAVAEFRHTADSCRLLTRSVVLADGGTGADALAAGWWTSFWQVPILLTAPDGSLPNATRMALQGMPIDHVIVLGGTGRIPEATANEAARLAGAAVGRVAGSDRYATSASMARVFGGWHGTGMPAAGAAGLVCVAASGGQGADARGWPDALAAGPWCARASGAAGNPGAPHRALAPVDGTSPLSPPVGGNRPARDAVPVLLVPPGGAVTTEVAEVLGGAFDLSGAWCSGTTTSPCIEPGFAVVFGGGAVVSQATVTDVARLVSGGTYTEPGDVSPSLGPGFWTSLDLRPVYRQGGEAPTAGGQLCWRLGGFDDVRWLALFAEPERTAFIAARDAATDRLYFRPEPGAETTSLPTCVPAPLTEDDVLAATGVSLSGRSTTAQVFDRSPEHRVRLDGGVLQSGAPSTVTADDRRSWRFEGVPEAPVAIVSASGEEQVQRATVTLTLDQRSRVGGAVPATGGFVLETAAGTMAGTIGGEAVLVSGSWEIRGTTVFRTLDGRPAAGGFTASVVESTADASVTWRLDGLGA